jgi:hypothetical protein
MVVKVELRAHRPWSDPVPTPQTTTTRCGILRAEFGVVLRF